MTTTVFSFVLGRTLIPESMNLEKGSLSLIHHIYDFCL